MEYDEIEDGQPVRIMGRNPLRRGDGIVRGKNREVIAGQVREIVYVNTKNGRARVSPARLEERAS